MEEQILSVDEREFKQVDTLSLRAKEVSLACCNYLQKGTCYCIKIDFLKAAVSLIMNQCVVLYSYLTFCSD